VRRIVFLLPSHVYRPSGGVKVVFEYANYLANHNWQVTVVSGSTASFRRVSWYECVKSTLRYSFILATRRYCPTWFNLNERIRTIPVPSLNQRFVPVADVYVATAVETAEQLMEYRTKARKLYLIQGYEDWNVGKDRLLATYRSDLSKIVIARWLYDRVSQYSPSQVTIIPNGFDFEKFGCDCPVEKRNPLSVAFMYHAQPCKDVPTGLRALELVHQKHPNLNVNMFGVYRKGRDIPDWMSYTQNPSQKVLRELYNKSSIYLAASRDEGWGLTVGEAMICGCAVCCTDCAGFKEMVSDGKNGLMSPIGDAVQLAQNLCNLIECNSQRAIYARSGMERIQDFSWENSFKKFEERLRSGE